LKVEVEMKACRFAIALLALGVTVVSSVGSAQPEETLTNDYIVKMVRAQLSVPVIRLKQPGRLYLPVGMGTARTMKRFGAEPTW
jgi:hypothetical protein